MAFISPALSGASTELGTTKLDVSQVIGATVVTPGWSGDQGTLPAVASAKIASVSPAEPTMWVQVLAVRSVAPSITLPGFALVMPLTPVEEKLAEVFPGFGAGAEGAQY